MRSELSLEIDEILRAYSKGLKSRLKWCSDSDFRDLDDYYILYSSLYTSGFLAMIHWPGAVSCANKTFISVIFASSFVGNSIILYNI